MSNNVQILNQHIERKTGAIKSVLFDFDGTLSLLREGWEGIMAPMMLEMIQPDSISHQEIEQDVKEYINQSTGILTIRQMEWLAETVKRCGYVSDVKTAAEYKSIYVERIRQKVAGRVKKLQTGQATVDEMMVPGTVKFITELIKMDKQVYLASGTDHEDVVIEAGILNLDFYFQPHIYGALDATETNDKEKIIQRILFENSLKGQELLVVGDGPVEIRLAVQNGAIALGVATDEENRQGLELQEGRTIKNCWRRPADSRFYTL